MITPNGDGINDRLRVTTDIINLVEGRPIRLRVFDMAGRIVWSTAESRQAGPFVIEWDGHGPDGALLPPGNYVWRIEAEGDARTQSDLGIVAIIY